MERLYIGGLDPPRLTVEEVASRLRSIQGIELVSVDGNNTTSDDKKFFFVNAKKCRRNGENEVQHDSSALKLVASQYHNVKWKGCKLSVEAAKPHFLERLAEERLQRRQQTERTTRTTSALPSENERPHDDDNNTVRIPRHLRIRQRFGEEAYHVDTKPYDTDDWSNFAWSMGRMNKRREKHRQQQQLKNKPQESKQSEMRIKPFVNRAVHLRFSDDDVVSKDRNRDASLLQANAIVAASQKEDGTAGSMTDNNRVSTEGRTSDEDSDDSELDSSTSKSSDSDGTGSFSSSNGIDTEKAFSAYVWSDDDEDEEDDDRIKVDGALYSQENVRPELKAAATTTLNAGESKRPYTWSSDDDESSSSTASNNEEEDITPPFKKPVAATADEFTAAFDDGLNAGSSRDSESIEDEVYDESNAETTDVLDDVKSNLDVLSKLFPDMAELKPRILQNETNQGVEATGRDQSTETREKSGTMIQPGWEMAPSANGTSSLTSKLGLMQRYDPTKESTQKYVVTSSPREKNKEFVDTEHMDEEEEEKAGVERSQNNDSHDGAQHEGTNSNLKIYEQSKLEHIFREARTTEGVKGFQLSSHFKENLPQDKSSEGIADQGGFAFSFDLGNKDEASAEVNSATKENPNGKPGDASGAFAFSFDVGVEAKSPSNDAFSTPDGPIQPAAEASQDIEQKTIVENYRTRRRGLILPTKVLDEYEAAFYSMNEGTRILEDLEGYRNDGEVRQRWLQERYALTQDWKRKRKYAQSRMQKKMKFR